MPDYRICFRFDCKTQRNFTDRGVNYDDLGLALTELKNLADLHYKGQWQFYTSGPFATSIKVGIPSDNLLLPILIGYISERKSTAELQQLIEMYNKELDSR